MRVGTIGHWWAAAFRMHQHPDASIYGGAYV